jgi:hypothetical protein
MWWVNKNALIKLVFLLNDTTTHGFWVNDADKVHQKGKIFFLKNFLRNLIRNIVSEKLFFTISQFSKYFYKFIEFKLYFN